TEDNAHTIPGVNCHVAPGRCIRHNLCDNCVLGISVIARVEGPRRRGEVARGGETGYGGVARAIERYSPAPLRATASEVGGVAQGGGSSIEHCHKRVEVAAEDRLKRRPRRWEVT